MLDKCEGRTFFQLLHDIFAPVTIERRGVTGRRMQDIHRQSCNLDKVVEWQRMTEPLVGGGSRLASQNGVSRVQYFCRDLTFNTPLVGRGVSHASDLERQWCQQAP